MLIIKHQFNKVYLLLILKTQRRIAATSLCSSQWLFVLLYDSSYFHLNILCILCINFCSFQWIKFIPSCLSLPFSTFFIIIFIIMYHIYFMIIIENKKIVSKWIEKMKRFFMAASPIFYYGALKIINHKKHHKKLFYFLWNCMYKCGSYTHTTISYFLFHSNDFIKTFIVISIIFFFAQKYVTENL